MYVDLRYSLFTSGILCRFLLCLLIAVYSVPCFAQNPQELPRFSIEGLQYQGAFRMSADTFGDSSLNYSEGPIQYNPEHHSLYIVGHSHHQAIAEFAIPATPGTGNIVSDLPIVEAPLQPFYTVLDRATHGNTQNINRIGGMHWFSTTEGPVLLVNAYEYYDAPGDNSHSTIVIDNADSLESSSVRGYFSYQGGAGHTSGWFSPVPTVWQSLLGGSYITGQSSGIPIISRTSVGPSAFVVNPELLLNNANSQGSVETIPLLDYSLEHGLHDDLSNSSGKNDLWTHLSRAVYGIIVPGTRTYLTLGYSGGHESGVCYKCEQSNGNTCGGYCAPDADDYHLYYWLWDLNDLLAVKNGSVESYDVRPYTYGIFNAPFDVTSLGGGTYDEDRGILYLSFQRADREQGQYANPPVIGLFSFSVNGGDSGGNDTEKLIGKKRKVSFYCSESDGAPACRVVRGSNSKLKTVSFAIKSFKRSVRKMKSKASRTGIPLSKKRMKKMRSSIKNARRCKKGSL